MSRRNRAFTLIELLVVVAVIAVLIAILLPSLGRARKQAKTTVCLTNERSLAGELRLYVQEWGVATLYGGHPSTYGAWDCQLLGGGMSPTNYYAGNGRRDAKDRIRYCPETMPPRFTNAIASGTAAMQWNCGVSGYSSGSYGYNTWLQKGQPPVPNCYDVRLIQRDFQVPAFSDAVSHDLVSRESDPVNNIQAPSVSANFGTLSSCGIDRHGRAVNVSFLDGHGETVNLGDLWTLKWSANWSRSQPQNVPWSRGQ